MKAAAILGKLKPDFGALGKGRFVPGFVKHWLWRREADAIDHRSDPPRPRPVALMATTGVVVAALGGLGGWLWLNAEHTLAAWRGAIPTQVVAVSGAAPPPSLAMPTAPEDPSGPKSGEAPAPAPALAIAAPPVPTRPPVEGPVVLAPAPAPGLVEDSPNGPLPRIADDGRRPWQVYARPFNPADKRPRIAIVIADMGLSGATTGNAIERLPPKVTLAFMPYSERLESWIERARGKGHEVMLSVPMEPQDFPRSDPGPNALLTGLGADRNVERLEWSLGKALGYVGIITTMGGKFTGNADASAPMVDVLKKRGLLYVDPKLARRPAASQLATESGVPTALVDRVIDRDLSRGAIDDQLRELETAARERGVAVGLGFPYPTTIERVTLWATGLEDRGMVLAPVSAVVNPQKGAGG